MNTESTVQELWVLDPTTGPEPVKAEMAPRPGTLDGKVLGLLDNSKFNAGRLLDLVAEILAREFKLAGIVKKRKPDASRGAPQEVLDDLAEKCNVAVVGVGD